MNKKVGSFVAVYLILFVVFNVVALVIPFKSCASRWITYAFMDIAIILSAGITWIAFSKGEDVKSKFYGFPIFKIGMIYTAVQFVVWLVITCVCFAAKVPAWVSVVVSIVILALALIGVIAADNTRDIVEEHDKKIVEQTRTIKTFSLNMTSLIAACKDENLRKAVEKLAEKVKYSDPVSSEATADIESQIQKEVDLLAEFIGADNSAAMEKVKEITLLLNERNILCKECK